MVKSVMPSPTKKQSKSRSSSTASEARASKVEVKPAKSKTPLQKTGLFSLIPLDTLRIKHVATNFAEAISWVHSQTNVFSHQSEAENASKSEYLWPYRSNPAVSERSPGRTRKAIPVFHNSCLSSGVRPPMKSTRNGGGGGKTLEFQWECIQDEAAHQGHLGNRHGRTIDTQITPSDLLGINEAVGKCFEQVILLSNFPSNKTRGETIGGALELAKYASTILNRIFKVADDKLESDNPSNSIESTEVPYIIDAEAKEVYLSLCNGFDEMSPKASEFCLRTINLIVNCMDERQGTTELALSSLLDAALEIVNTYCRIDRVREKMIIKRRGEFAVINWSVEQDESRTKHLLNLVESVIECVITIQHRVMQAALVQPPEMRALNEEASKLESHLQQSWACLIKISKRVGVLCPRGKQVLFVYLLERFIGVTGELSRYQEQLLSLNVGHCKERLASAASFCQKMLLQSLMQVLKIAEKAGFKFRNEGLVSLYHFAQIAEASQIHSITLTLLLSLIAKQEGTTIFESQHFSETLRSYREELMYFAKPCMAVIQQLAIEVRTTPFENHSGRTATESPNDALILADGLYRRLPVMPSTGRFDRVNINAITVVKELWKRSSGQVILALFDNNYVALKKLTCQDPIKASERLERQAKIHQRINSHPNILRFLGRAVQLDEHGGDQIMSIITDWCRFGNLSEAINQAASVQELYLDGKDISSMQDGVGYQLYKYWTKRLEVVSGIAAGMVHMHKHHIVHRDLTSGSVLLDRVDKNGRIGVKVCDFECGYYLENGESIQRSKAPANSAPWMGPEVLKHEKYDLKADVYSIGTILWELMFLENPWTHLEKRVRADKLAIQYFLSAEKVSLSISEDDAPEGVSEFPELVRLVKHAWERDPGNRPTMIEFYKAIRDICTRMKERLSAEEAKC